MNKKILLGSIGAVVILILASMSGVVATPKEEFVEVEVEVCGVEGSEPYSVKLTEQQAEEIEILWDELKVKLDDVETREETIEIYKEMVIELDKYGILGDMSIKDAQELVPGWYNSPKILNIIGNRFNEKLEEDENKFCLIAGKTDNTVVTGIMYRSLVGTYLFIEKLYNWLNENNFEKLLDILYNLIIIVLMFLIQNPEMYLVAGALIGVIGLINPISIVNTINIGYIDYTIPYSPGVSKPAKGWIHTTSINVTKKWEGSLFGHLPLVHPLFLYFEFFPGVQGFTGLKIINPKGEMIYLGSAVWVKIE